MQRKGLIARWALPVAIGLIAIVVLFFGDDAALRLRYDRAAVAAGEFLRLISAHGVHLGPAHLAMNIVGLGVVWFLVGEAFSPARWTLIIASSIALIDLGLWFLMPALDWYVGLSGLLHGMLAAGIAGIWRTRRQEAMIIAGVLLAKLGYEMLLGPLPGAASTAGGDVITDAHFFGALGGFAAGFAICIRVRPAASI